MQTCPESVPAAAKSARKVILSYGMGVESQAILEKWIHEPESRPFDSFDELVVVTSQVGEEHLCDTVVDVEARTLPLLRIHRIRFVELARRGHLEEDGIVVIQDTNCPERLHPEGVFKLSDELLLSGTVPQFGGEHRCALKFKAFVVETWLAHEFRGGADVKVFHAFGYNAGELGRISKSEFHIAQHNEERAIEASRKPIVVFGFNAGEIGRIERSKLYDGPNRTGLYPLQEWGWDRARCIDYIKERSGRLWRKSHCSFCPFCREAVKAQGDAARRWLEAPQQTAHGLLVEYNSLCFNPRGQLYRECAMIDAVKKAGAGEAIRIFEERLKQIEWALYRVRRIYSKKGKAFRCVEKIATGSRAEMAAAFQVKSQEHGIAEVQQVRGIAYAMFQKRIQDVYPAAEGFLVAAPMFVETKVRGSIETFNQRWERVIHGEALNGETRDPNQTTMPLAESDSELVSAA